MNRNIEELLNDKKQIRYTWPGVRVGEQSVSKLTIQRLTVESRVFTPTRFL
jgi:hypothetical protein